MLLHCVIFLRNNKIRCYYQNVDTEKRNKKAFKNTFLSYPCSKRC